ncbi:YdcH family protein [Rhodoferax mekongensis]|nr:MULTISPECIES: YdcH family protein [unclassified Rhodoferax]
MAHHEMDVCIDNATLHGGWRDDLQLRRLKKRRLALRDEIVALEFSLSPDALA